MKIYYVTSNKMKVDLANKVFKDYDVEIIEENIDTPEIQSIKGINVTFVNPDHFLMETYDFPISMYTLQQLQQLEQKNLKTSKPLSKDISLLLERIRKKYKK